MRVGIVGAGLAGCECAMALARCGVDVVLFEMKPRGFSPAHTSEDLAELVCSNSFRSDDPESAVGLLKLEMAEAGSLVMAVARQTAVPAGKALAVDRGLFSAEITARIQAEPRIRLERREIQTLDDPDLAGLDAVVLAAGPLASDALARDLARVVGHDSLYFYDAIAPIVDAASIDLSVAFRASRYEDGPGDYLNCPMDETQYRRFVADLVAADKVKPREFETHLHFEGCLPIETMAERGEMTLAFGPLKPVGLTDPKTGRRPFAVIQLRPENSARTMYNMVGFQTKLTYPEQLRVFRTIPGLEHAEFVRLGSIHRNTFVDAPKTLSPCLELLARPGTYLAGQITGVEGYVESAACGLWLGLHLAARLHGRHLPPPPPESAMGALLAHLHTDAKHFQPMNVNFGLSPALTGRHKKVERKALYASRARDAWARWREENV
ncbi:methylenetetrahydrofolate--tRNA-(uracil(54)-C(5))-methyltransferase (FADH(2)-oxidizing) TrmFO [Desulfolutivibrio sulfoxidireducens]|uniref:methylenetetrahydrofolate--tRNA-(uracil(54)- C(5))-methyltransferase (FADH(2)-oxidizing) TrmFO n=1 Tax=Desulfolutivibrio sulfoxidireducens TaxID=2773299 RepID=UPI00159D0DEA|nr:methylenetetrahydrofolate--tRNA-(uracil(54)-C(5))-methyltransferase (FADH(2)-oxidizing) TrmFO [Desulfolutivibrio sulfoxidireducens]QLA17642.1 methylenetetrahydrofolate--tRNA-(uracil(54)-C(5))-methyltransferase (FADH(2)-oxidizing) TrmFO [Desulfolutivibrio sulfoxidireducens]QLA21214.1 methylenetetrahydrofolate--tRNA-(uracil(54)-C(5))-methyltransferase (FADH(2)-oxidizing) TrmFO [Desulfolutivibrio sulfoxidireducens]